MTMIVSHHEPLKFTSLLFGLASGGVFTAITVTRDAVRSYRHHFTLTLTPGASKAVYFLLHFPYCRPCDPQRRTLSDTLLTVKPGLSSERNNHNQQMFFQRPTDYHNNIIPPMLTNEEKNYATDFLLLMCEFRDRILP